LIGKESLAGFLSGAMLTGVLLMFYFQSSGKAMGGYVGETFRKAAVPSIVLTVYLVGATALVIASIL
jgi:hypothetical protein